MPSVHDLKESRFVTQHDVDPDVLVTIKSYEEINVAKPGCDPEYRWCLWFDELEKPMTLNSTNGGILAAITGSEDFDGWLGAVVVLYRDPSISFGGRAVGGIRIRAPKDGFKKHESEPKKHDDIPF